MKFLQEIGWKFLKGINVVEHQRELANLRTNLLLPLSILFVGSSLSSALFVLGSWKQVAALTSPMLHEYIVSLVSIFAISELARQLFGAKIKTKEYVEWIYIGRYLKGFLLAGAVFVPAIFMAQFGMDEMGRYIFFYGAQPKTMAVVVWLGLLSLVSLALGALVLYLFRLALIFSTYTLALIMQGRGFKEAIVKGSRLFSSHWPYVAGLILLFMVCATGIEGLFELCFVSNSSIVVSESRGFLLSVLLLLYCALFFSYHRRVSKVPTSR